MSASLPQHSIYRSVFKDLNEHVINQLQPTEEFNRRCNQTTDRLATFLKQQSGFSVAKTVKGGSLGKGTAIRGHADLDLVLFLNGYPTVGDFKRSLPDITTRLEQAVRRWTPGDGFTVAVLERKNRIVYMTMNTRLNDGSTFRLRVDLVPAFSRRDAPVIYQEMGDLSVDDDRSYYSSSLAKQQISFVSTRPASLKNLIRLVKDWRKTHLRDAGAAKIPKSYALELVTIDVWERAGSRLSFRLDGMFKSVLLTLVNYQNLHVSWTMYYSSPERDLYSWGTMTPGKPFLLDPADPFHNVGNDFVWDEMAQMALVTANSPRLSHVMEAIGDGDDDDDDDNIDKRMSVSLPQHSIYKSMTKDLNEHVTKQLQPNEEFNRRCNQATDRLATFLKQQSGFSVAETVKGGSLGKGTAIRGHADLDLVVFLNGYPTVSDFRRSLPHIVTRLEQAVCHWKTADGFSVDVLDRTNRSVYMTMNTPVGDGSTFRLRVDLVPAFDRRDASVIYQDMVGLSADDRSYYSSSLAKQQIGFVLPQPARLKDLIRLVKDWRKTHLRDAGAAKIPKSYALELVTIHVWERAGSPLPFGIESMFKSVLLALVNYQYLNVSWTKYYSSSQPELYASGTMTSGKPFLLDPADPFHNVVNDFIWDEMAQMALVTANSPRLSQVKPIV